jgi:arginine deiminase
MIPQVFNETDVLEEVLVWGEPGCEALLGQLLPKTRSLFFSFYEVPQARVEFRRMQALIESEGVTVTRAKDAVAQMLKHKEVNNAPSSIRELKAELLSRADELYELHREHKIRELEREGIRHDVDDIYSQVKKDISILLEEDADTYGEIAAVRLNHVLSLSHPLPLANIFYGRDQTQALTDKILLSSLRWDIRRPEVNVYKEALMELGYFESLVPVERGTIEGGDIAILGDTCFIGVGARTSYSAAKDVCRKIGPLLASQGIQIVAVINKRHEQEAANYGAPTDEHMHIMHLDMFWIPLSDHLVMAYGEEVEQRTAIRLTHNSNQLIMEEMGSLRVFLAAKGIDIINVTRQEQENFATNLLNMGNRTLMVSLSRNKRVIAELESRGYRIINAEITKLVNGYGAVHCLTAPVRRQRTSVARC